MPSLDATRPYLSLRDCPASDPRPRAGGRAAAAGAPRLCRRRARCDWQSQGRVWIDGREAPDLAVLFRRRPCLQSSSVERRQKRRRGSGGGSKQRFFMVHRQQTPQKLDRSSGYRTTVTDCGCADPENEWKPNILRIQLSCLSDQSSLADGEISGKPRGRLRMDCTADRLDSCRGVSTGEPPWLVPSRAIVSSMGCDFVKKGGERPPRSMHLF